MSKTLFGLDKAITGLDGRPLVEPDGAPVIPRTLLANALARGQSHGQEARAMDVALRVYNAKDSIELEDADYVLLKQAVEQDQILNNLAKTAALAVLDALADSSGG